MIGNERMPSISLTSLKLVPPPTKYHGDTNEDVWDPFPAPYAPHGQPKETRDAQESRRPSTSDERVGDGAWSTREEVDAVRPKKTPNPKSSSSSSSACTLTPPRIPQPRRVEASYSSSERRSRHGSSRRSRSSTPVKKQSSLLKVSANGSVTGKGSLQHHLSSPILTKGRVDQHLKGSQSDSNLSKSDVEISKDQDDVKRSSTKPAKYGQRSLMIGTNKVYSRTLIPPTVYHNAVTDNWIVTINTSSKLTNTITNILCCRENLVLHIRHS